MVRISFIISFFILFSACSIFVKQEKSHGKRVKLSNDEEYYYAFTEATKQKLFGNIDRAENLYLQCLKVKPQNPATFYQLSKTYILKGDADNAELYASKAFRFEQGNYWYALNKAQVYELTGKTDSAIVVYEYMFNNLDNKVNVGYRFCRLLEDQQRYKKALDIYNRIENLMGGKDKQLLISKVLVYVQLEMYDKAIEELENGLLLYPGDKDLLTYIAKVYSVEGNEEMAGEKYKSLIDADSTDIEALFSYIVHLNRYGKNNEAIGLIKRMKDKGIEIGIINSLLIELFNSTDVFDGNEKDLIEILNNLDVDEQEDIRSKALLVDCYVSLDSLSKATDILEDMIDQEKSSYVLWEQLISLYSELEAHEKVVQFSDSAIRHFDDRPVFYMYKGFALKSLDELDLAAQAFEKGIDLSSSQQIKLSFYAMLGDIYYSLNEYEKSDSAFNYVLSYDSSRTIVLNNYSYYLSLRNERLDDAERMMKKCIQLDSTKYSYYDTYGWVLFKKGDYKKAAKYIELALEMGGEKSCEVVEHYGDVLKKLDRKSEALEYYIRARECSDTADEIIIKINQLKEHSE